MESVAERGREKVGTEVGGGAKGAGGLLGVDWHEEPGV